MAVAERADLEAGLRADAEAAWAAIEATTSADEVLQALPRAWTLADLALRVLADVNLIDRAVYVSREAILRASHEARLLFPSAAGLLAALSCAAAAHVARFEYRLDLGDLDEATFLAGQVLALGPDDALDEGTWVRATMALASADLWRYRVRGDQGLIDSAVRRLRETVRVTDPLALGLLAECLRHLAGHLRPEQALLALEDAGRILNDLLDPESGVPQLKVQPWIEASWGATWTLVELAGYQVSGDKSRLSRAVQLGRTSIEHVLPSTAEAEAAHLAALLTYISVDGVTPEWDEVAARQVQSAIAAGTGRYWYALTSALTHAEWSLPRGWSQPATTSARIAYDIADQAVSLQAGEEYRRPWIPWLARTTGLAVPALAAAAAPGPAASRLEQARTRILAERFVDDIAELNEVPADLSEEVASRLARNLRVLRDPTVSRITKATARDEVVRVTMKVRERPGMARFRWKLEPDELLRALDDSPTVYLAPGHPHGVAILGGGSLGEWHSVPLPEAGLDPAPVTRFVQVALSPGALPGARRRAVDPITAWLGTSVWQLIAEELTGVEQLWLVPCGYFGLLPCHAGRLGGDGDTGYALGRWDIRYAVTARSLARAKGLPQPAVEPMFVGIPQPSGQVALPGAGAELQAAANGFARGRLLDAANVTPAAALDALENAGYLHAACHGAADPGDPLMSGLELGPEGRLTLRDLSRIRTGLELSVLSACETNVPDPAQPDEAMSLAVGLHLTGCRGVVASSWRVPDSATLALMERFYRYWRGPDRFPVTDALRRAQLDLAASDRWHEPYYWAGFSFLGAPPSGTSRTPSAVST